MEPASAKSRRRALRSRTGGGSPGCSRGSGSNYNTGSAHQCGADLGADALRRIYLISSAAGPRSGWSTTMTPPPTVHRDLVAPATSVIGAAIARDRRRVLADLLALAKPRVVLMILVTTAVGYYAGLTGAPDYARLLHVLVGPLRAAGRALPLNP